MGPPQTRLETGIFWLDLHIIDNSPSCELFTQSIQTPWVLQKKQVEDVQLVINIFLLVCPIRIAVQWIRSYLGRLSQVHQSTRFKFSQIFLVMWYVYLSLSILVPSLVQWYMHWVLCVHVFWLRWAPPNIIQPHSMADHVASETIFFF